MNTSLSQRSPGAQRGDTTRVAPGATQMGFSFDAKMRIQQRQDALVGMFRDALKLAGGSEWLARSLDRSPSYESKINDGIAGRDERTVQLPWLAPILEDPAALDFFINALAEAYGYTALKNKQAKQEELAAAALEVLSEIKDEEQREVFKRRVAKKCGVRAEDVKL